MKLAVSVTNVPFAFAFALVATFAAEAAVADLSIFAEGAYKANIVLPATPNGVEKYAAEELAYHFKKAFGKAPEVVGEDKLDSAQTPFHIYVGATKAAVAAGLYGKVAEAQERMCAPSCATYSPRPEHGHDARYEIYKDMGKY